MQFSYPLQNPSIFTQNSLTSHTNHIGGGRQGGLDPLPPGFNPPTPAQISPPYPSPFFSKFIFGYPPPPPPQKKKKKNPNFCPRSPPVSPPPIFRQKPPLGPYPRPPNPRVTTHPPPALRQTYVSIGIFIDA